MFTLFSWGARKILSGQSAKRLWVRRLLFLLTVLRWIHQRLNNKASRIALKRGESLYISIQKNGGAPQ
ncbi:unannotated protein [freshwater metagenome]|uniref:Unannotated protein n=1 Tax=freshwater metagenome TaxID=449393 RepID=A0A6J6K9U9_9ZZZZ|nr:hypothetical protein [Actinomycetota bacterium]